MTINLKMLVLGGVLGAGLLLGGCKKEDPKPTPAPAPAPAPPPTKTENLANKNYKMTGATVNPGIEVMPGVVITDWYAQMDACVKDNIFKFEAANKDATSGVYTNDEGATKCDPSDPQTITGTWAWNTDQTILTITESGESFSIKIVQNDGTTLKGTAEEEMDGVVYTITYTFTKQ